MHLPCILDNLKDIQIKNALIFLSPNEYGITLSAVSEPNKKHKIFTSILYKVYFSKKKLVQNGLKCF